MYSHEQLVEMRRRRKSPLQEFAGQAAPAIGSAVAEKYAQEQIAKQVAAGALAEGGLGATALGATAGPLGVMGAMYGAKLLGLNQGTTNTAKSNYLSPRILKVFEDAMAMGLQPSEVKDPARRAQYEAYIKSMSPKQYKDGTQGAGSCPMCGMQYANDGMSGVQCLKCGKAKVAKYGYGTKSVGPLMKY